ncbi:alternative ribosome rescue aminoacyl-tRNA hydrolase ArfB [Aureitalea marina]|uniref:Aminoacyl-tRNA hydrolase n=1 Tax=Aureitalea marina TaxID=930804 RepID=A0A2S7KT45_9FLAO|nr:alternative ribosome rescue aminoacyl-tRNA hydrolase ArfB [Aureitalea marina]PQB05800.1 aminoacyl-tRNA hydrolase [Aureitalea marina]
MEWGKIISELKYRAVRSSGPGGQHVNKTSTKVELTFNPSASLGLTEEEKFMILEKLSARISKEGKLILQSDQSRSQSRNKEEAVLRLKELLEEALKKPKVRKATKPSKASRQKRLDNKRHHASKKAGRKPPQID